MLEKLAKSLAARIDVSHEEISNAKRDAIKRQGTGSFFLDIFGSPLMKRPALSESVAKYREGVDKIDSRAGEALGKIPGVGRAFKTEVKTPIKSVHGFEVSKVENVHKLTAPIVKAQKFLVPILAYEGMRRMIGKHEDSEKKAGEKNMTREEQVVLMKAAAVIDTLGKQNEWLTEQLAIALHEKQATKLAHTMVDKGLIEASDLEKQATELTKGENMEVVKKAIELNEAGFTLGKLEKAAAVEGNEGAELDPLTQYLVDHIHGR